MLLKPTFLTVMVSALLLTGCGGGSAAGVDPSLMDDGSSGMTSDMPLTTTPLTSAPAAIAAPAPALQDITATVTSKSGGLLSKFSCVVEVSNPNSVARTGSVTVTFTHSGKAEDGSPAQTQAVSLQANETKQLTFKDNKYHFLSEDATVEVTSDPVQSSAPSTMATGLGMATTPSGY